MLPAVWQIPVLDFFTAGALASCEAAAALGAVCAACTDAAPTLKAQMHSRILEMLFIYLLASDISERVISFIRISAAAFP